MSNSIFSGFLLVFLLLITLSAKAQTSPPFTLKINPYRGAIQWEQSTDRTTWTNVPNGAVATMTVQPNQTTYFRAKITESGCSPIYSDLKAVLIEGNLQIGGKQITGKIELPTGAAVDLTQYTVLSFVDEVKVNNDGSFNVVIPDSSAEDLLLVINKNGEVVMMSAFMGSQSEYRITSESTALALLLMYPLLKPVSASKKEELITLYKSQPEFNTLLQQVQILNQGGLNLFSLSNETMIQAINLLIGKDFNKDRAKIQQPQTVLTVPIDIYAHQSSTTIKNGTQHSYTGGIYNKDNSLMGSRFTVNGSLMEESSFIYAIFKVLKQATSGPHQNNLVRETSPDLKAMGLQPGEYEIRMRSGLAMDGSEENRIAMVQNIYEFVSLVISNLVSATMFIDNDCLKAYLNARISVINPFNFADAAQKGTWLTNYIWPIFKDFATFVATDASYNCTKVKASKVFATLFKYYDLAEKLYPITTYSKDWALNPSKVDGCQSLSRSFETSNCFVLKRINNTAAQYYTCDTVELIVQTLANDKYYPYKADPVGFRDFLWLSLQGSGGFGPDGSINAAGKSDANGFASVKWGLSSTATANWAKAVANNSFDNGASFTTKTFIPVFKVLTSGGNETGTINTALTNPITLKVVDDKGQALPVEYFDVQWEVIKGGGSIPEFVLNFNNSSVWKWTLGTQPGEQVVKATIKRKGISCSWQLDGAPLTFNATATTGYTLSNMTTSTLSGEIEQILSTPLVVKVLNSDNAPVSNIDVQWTAASGSGTVTGVTQTNTNGEASARWKLGTTVGTQTVTVKAFYNGVEITGSPVIFIATAKSTVCSAPVITSISNTENSAEVFWTATGALGFNVSIESNWTGYDLTDTINLPPGVYPLPFAKKSINNIAGTSYKIENLNPASDYVVKVQAVCASSSSESSIQYFTTKESGEYNRFTFTWPRFSDASLFYNLPLKFDPKYTRNFVWGPDLAEYPVSCTAIIPPILGYNSYSFDLIKGKMMKVGILVQSTTTDCHDLIDHTHFQVFYSR